MLKHNLVTQGDVQNITVLVNGELQTASTEHPNFPAILKAVVLDKSDDENAVERLFDTGKAVSQEFKKVSERVAVKGGNILLDGDPVDGALTKQILRFLDEGHNFTPLVKFLERVTQNPDTHSRDQLYSWLARHDFAITDDGKFVAYKGVQNDGKYSSIHSGPGVVDGVEVTQVTNAPGSVVEIARSKVHHNPGVGCASGLHAGTWSYARDFGRVVVEVHIDPRDVVSVPTDCDAQKLRTCRYTVIGEATTPNKSAYIATAPVEADLRNTVGPESDYFQPNSSFIDRVEWDGEEQAVTVYLSDGDWYQYAATYADFKAFLEASNGGSAGAYYNGTFKPGRAVISEGNEDDYDDGYDDDEYDPYY